MCDTLYVAPNASAGSAWFAKNSDRNPAEPQSICIVPRGSSDASLGHYRGGHAFVLSRPVWMEGGEMGVNDIGVAIGNEAVFSRFKAKKDGLLGMAILRSALANADSAAEARDFICGLVEERDQGGNGAYKGSLVYSNSFIVAGRDGAYVVETAGRRWAWKTIEGVATISNAYSIEGDYQGLDKATRAEGIGSWRERVEDRFYLAFTKGGARRSRTTGSLLAAKGSIDLATMLGVLRDHGDGVPGRAGMAAPCLHEAGFPMKSTTTASLVFETPPPGSPSSGLLWFSGRSYPCLCVFAPILLADGEFLPLWTGYDYAEGGSSAQAYWEAGLALAKRLGGARRSDDPAFVAMRDGIQARLLAVARDAAQSPHDEQRFEVARREVGEAMSEWEASISVNAGTGSGPPRAR